MYVYLRLNAEQHENDAALSFRCTEGRSPGFAGKRPSAQNVPMEFLALFSLRQRLLPTPDF